MGCGSSPCERGAKRARNETNEVDTRSTSEAKTSEVHEEPIKSIIWVSHKTSSTSDREAKTNEVDTRSTSEAKTSEEHEEPIKLIIWVSHKTSSTSD